MSLFTVYSTRRITMSTSEETRIERDSMGEMQVPAHAYWGASTHRAVLNFPISDLRFQRQFVRALGQIKQAAAQVNESLGTVDPQIAEAIVQADSENWAYTFARCNANSSRPGISRICGPNRTWYCSHASCSKRTFGGSSWWHCRRHRRQYSS